MAHVDCDRNTEQHALPARPEARRIHIDIQGRTLKRLVADQPLGCEIGDRRIGLESGIAGARIRAELHVDFQSSIGLPPQRRGIERQIGIGL